MDPITATYVQDDEDWTVTVAGLGEELTARAPGIIAARDRTDQLVDKLVPEGKVATVVHLINGSALEFTTAYMTARLTRPEPAAEPEEPEAVQAIEAAAAEAEQAAADGKKESAKTEEGSAPELPKQTSGEQDGTAIVGTARLGDLSNGKFAGITGELEKTAEPAESGPARAPRGKAAKRQVSHS